MNDLIERLLAGPQPDRHSGVIMEEAADEIERLRQCLQYEQHRAERIGTHGQGCWSWGPQHYECALREIEELRSVMSQSEPVAWASRINKVLVGTKFYQSDIYDIPLYLHPHKPDTEELEALRRDRNGWKDVADMGEKIIAARDEQLTRYRAVMKQAVEAMEKNTDNMECHFDFYFEALAALREALKEE